MFWSIILCYKIRL